MYENPTNEILVWMLVEVLVKNIVSFLEWVIPISKSGKRNLLEKKPGKG